MEKSVSDWLRRNNLWYYLWDSDTLGGTSLVIYRNGADGRKHDILIIPGEVQ